MTIDPTESDERISLESSRRKSRSSIRQPSSSVGRRSTTGNPGSLSFVYFFGLAVAPGNVRRRARVATSAGVGVERPVLPILPPGRSHPIHGILV
jgi:hypothetical protein